MINLNRQKQGDKVSLHKPLLLLLAIGAWQQKRDLDWSIVKEELGRLLKQYGGVSVAKPAYPFIRLQHDGWWEVDGYAGIKGDASVPELDRLNPRARLSEAFSAKYLTSEESLADIVKYLMAEFPESVREELKHAVHINLELTGFFWVNQGKTYGVERSLECLWAPMVSKDGRRLHHWDQMDNVRPGDFILNYCDTTLKGYCVAKTASFAQSQPELGQTIWEADGRMIHAEYFPFPKPLPLSSFSSSIRDLLPEKYSPLKKVGTGANEGYLYSISDKVFAKIMNIAGQTWKSDGITEDASNPEGIYVPSGPTEKVVTASRRVTQPQFRMNLIKKWNGRCAVNGCTELEVLTASHIVPWRHATDAERNDPDNGLLLSPVYDRLFDRELISFGPDGRIEIGKTIRKNCDELGVSGKEQITGLTKGQLKYLERHRALLR